MAPFSRRMADAERPVPLANATSEGLRLHGEIQHFSGYGAFASNSACMSDADCFAGQVCDAATATCVGGTNPMGCSSDADCPMGQVCDPATATCTNPNPAGCTSDADCPMGQTCDPATATCS